MNTPTFNSAHLAQLALNISAITIKTPPDYFKWAKGWKTPIYNDNRQHLGFHENRKVILQGLKKITKKIEAAKDFDFDYILGTSMSAIAWGALLAYDLNKSFIILHDKKPYEFVNLEETFILPESNLPLLTNAPWGIPEGVITAHATGRPFMYERSEAKSHGMKNKIEGNIIEGSKVDIIWYGPHQNTNEVEGIKDFTEKNRKLSFNLNPQSRGTFPAIVRIVNLKNKKVLIIEDLISTGGSSLEEAKICRNLGAIVNDIIAIYNYEFPVALRGAKDAEVKIHNLLTYEKLLEVAIKENYISEDKLEILREWREDPEAWSDKYCGTNFTNNGYEKLAGV